MKKVGFYILCALIVLVTAAGTFFAITVTNINMQEDAFHAAMAEYREAINAEEPDIEKITELAGNIYTDDYYGSVEQAAKEYMRDLFIPYYTAKLVENEMIFKDGITKELIESDQPKFEKTIEVLDDMDYSLTALHTAIDSLFSRDTALKYFGTEEDLNEDTEPFFSLYEEQVEELYTNTELQSKLLDYYEKTNKKLTAYREVINFLVTNEGSWHLEGDSVVFKTTWLTNQYNQMLANLAQE